MLWSLVVLQSLFIKKLVDRVKSDDELAVVLAHELGHVLAKHSEEDDTSKDLNATKIGGTILGTLASVAMSAAGYSGGADLVGDLTSTTTQMIGSGLVLRFDRRQEYEADHIGLLIMAKAGYDPKVALDFWGRSEEVFGSSNSKLGSFFSTHPASSDRQKALEEALPYSLAIYEKAKR